MSPIKKKQQQQEKKQANDNKKRAAIRSYQYLTLNKKKDLLLTEIESCQLCKTTPSS